MRSLKNVLIGTASFQQSKSKYCSPAAARIAHFVLLYCGWVYIQFIRVCMGFRTGCTWPICMVLHFAPRRCVTSTLLYFMLKLLVSCFINRWTSAECLKTIYHWAFRNLHENQSSRKLLMTHFASLFLSINENGVFFSHANAYEMTSLPHFLQTTRIQAIHLMMNLMRNFPRKKKK